MPVPPRETASWPDQPAVMDVAARSAVDGLPPSVRVTLVSSALVRAAPVISPLGIVADAVKADVPLPLR